MMDSKTVYTQVLGEVFLQMVTKGREQVAALRKDGMMQHRLHNIGLIVRDIEKTVETYCDLFELDRDQIQVVDMKEDRLKMAFVSLGGTLLEIYQPVGPPPRDTRHLTEMREIGEGVFHLAFMVEEYEQEVQRLRQKGYEVAEDIVTDLDPRYETRLAWVPPESTGGYWLELIDEATASPAWS